MPYERDIELFIESASRLLEAFPSSTLVSITYANEAKKHSKKKIIKDVSKRATNSVTFKCYEPKSGKCIKYKTKRTKELSRLLTFLGPKGVTVSKSRKRSLEAVNLEPSNETAKIEAEMTTDHAAGLASIMSNCKYDTDESKIELKGTNADAEETRTATNAIPAFNEQESLSTTPSSSKNKKKKKKAKK
ncbi:uncharacterized protein PRCAT00003984001 [Priceomyces carsonii]|uniref:uncharacterized protein n=1 Tax=Priceomyces carsonii TaxID=28549 RepID=UPI002ED87ED9|nr:unnamed protein product [Priceomyces carsonii]